MNIFYGIETKKLKSRDNINPLKTLNLIENFTTCKQTKIVVHKISKIILNQRLRFKTISRK